MAMIISTSLVMFRPFARGPAETRLLSSQTHIGHVLIACYGRGRWRKQQAGWIKLWGIWKQKEGYSDMIATEREKKKKKVTKNCTLAAVYLAACPGWHICLGLAVFCLQGVRDRLYCKETDRVGRANHIMFGSRRVQA